MLSTDDEGLAYPIDNTPEMCMNLAANSSMERGISSDDLTSNAERDLIEKQAGHPYLSYSKDDVTGLRALIAERNWIGFDLDDTLHEFRHSAGKATEEVLMSISERYASPLPALRVQYARILKENTANAFSDGKTSYDYRRERVARLLAHFSLPEDDQCMTELLELYEETLMTSLELKCGALDLLKMLRDIGKKVIVITEGPQDAQERTIHRLGIGGYIDFLATTNHFGVAKTHGLFRRVIEHLNISPDDLAYVGDNEHRDIQPAAAEGIFAIHLAETKHMSLNATPPRINTLKDLQFVLSASCGRGSFWR